MARERHEDRLDLADVTVALRDAVSASQDLAGRLAATVGVGVSDMQALYWLEREGAMGPAALARRLGIRSASATVLVDRLERAGLVTRERDGADRRRVTVAVTERAAEANLATWLPAIRAIDAEADRLGARERQVVADYLHAVTAAMAAVDP